MIIQYVTNQLLVQLEAALLEQKDHQHLSLVQSDLFTGK